MGQVQDQDAHESAAPTVADAAASSSAETAAAIDRAIVENDDPEETKKREAELPVTETTDESGLLEVIEHEA